MTFPTRVLVVSAIVGLPLASVGAQQHPDMPAGMTHAQHIAQMKKEAEMKQHGQMAMGFEQDKATHHFTLTTDGGLIAITANDAADQATRDQIRTHLQELAQSFVRGDFEKPLMTHSEMPPGVTTMQRLKAAITYRFEATERGGILRMTTPDPDGREAVHDFLRYQIKEHGTGDPVNRQK